MGKKILRKNKAHVYINADGKDVPSVTHILQLIKKSGINTWANYLGFKRINFRKLVDDKAILGRALHSRINAFLTGGKWIPPMDYETELLCDEYWKLFGQWYNSARPEIISTELELIGKLYGGTLDLLCRTAGETVLLDFKTATKATAEHFLQLGGYLNLLEELKPDLYNEITYCQIVVINPERGVKVVTRSIDEMQAYKIIFNYAYILYIEYDKLLRRDWNNTLADIDIF